MSRITRIAVPLLKAEDVKPHLGRLTHWRQGRSAKSVADSWFAANDLPAPIRALLQQSPDLQNAELVDAWLERKTDLGDGRATASQSDLLAILGIGAELAVMGVEAKVDESFGPVVAEWLSDDSSGKKARLEKLCGLFGIAVGDALPLRYQLFHRTAAAVIEAKRYRASKAIIVIQSYCPNATGLADCKNFFAAIGLAGFDKDNLIGPRPVDGVDLWGAWACDTPIPEK